MWNSHSSVGVSQSVFYFPLIFIALWLSYTRAGKVSFPWILLTLFSTVRFVGGIFLIILQNHSSAPGWIIVATIFLGAGVVPLLLVQVGMLLIIRANDHPDHKRLFRAIISLRLFFGVGVVMLIAGSSLIGNYTDVSSVETGLKLAKAGYVLIAVTLLITICFSVWLLARGWTRSVISRRAAYAILLSAPFLAIRIVYALLGIFNGSSKWSPLFGDIAPLVIMHSIMEYVVVLIGLVSGFIMLRGQPNRKNTAASFEDSTREESGLRKGQTQAH